MRRFISVVTIPFLAPVILFSHAAYIDGNIIMSLPVIVLAAVIPLLSIMLYTKKTGGHREMREELKVRRIFMITLGLSIMLFSEYYKSIDLKTLQYTSMYYGLGTFIAGVLTLLGHKTSVHAMAWSVSGFLELSLYWPLGVAMILVSIISGISRIKLQAHTKVQVLTGFFIGVVSYLIAMVF